MTTFELNEPLVQIDNFSVAQYLTCPRKFYWRIVKGLVPNRTGPALGFGIAVHAGLAAQYSNNNDLAIGLAAFVEEYKKYPNMDATRSLGAGIGLLTEHHKTYNPEWFDVEHVEVGFSIELSSDLIYNGRIDLIGVEKATGNTVVIDHKTASRSPSGAEIKHRQITGYVFAARELVGQCSGGILNYLVNTKEPKCIRRFSSRTPEQLEDWRRATIKIVQRIRESLEPDDFWCNQESCSYYGACDYLDLCNSYGETQERLIRGLYQESKWTPYETQEGAD